MEIVKFAVSVCFFREKRCGKHCSEPVETRWKTGRFGKMPNGEEEKKASDEAKSGRIYTISPRSGECG